MLCLHIHAIVYDVEIDKWGPAVLKLAFACVLLPQLTSHYLLVQQGVHRVNLQTAWMFAGACFSCTLSNNYSLLPLVASLLMQLNGNEFACQHKRRDVCLC